jgi:recombinational DNA repair protein RecR
LEPSQIINAINAFNSVYQFLKNLREIYDKSARRKLFDFLKRADSMERKFKEALAGTKSAIEFYVWYGKGFAAIGKCSSTVDGNFDHLMGYIIRTFNDIDMMLDPKKLDKKLVDHLIHQLKMLENNAQSFWNIQGISSHQKPDEDAMKIIEDFRKALSDFQASMSPYLKPQT